VPHNIRAHGGLDSNLTHVNKSQNPSPLDGVRIVEIAAGRSVAYCGQLLAQCGAEVIRIEPPGGDEIRLAGPFREDVSDPNDGGLHTSINRGKRSVVLDLERNDDTELASRLINSATLLLTSWRAGGQLPLNEPKLIAELFPKTTYLSISEFGIDGPHAGWEADSHILEGLAGMSYVSGAPDREPLSIGVELADYFAAVHGWISALVALAAGHRDTQTRFIDLSMHESLTMTDDHNLTVYLGMQAIRRRYYSRILPGYPSDIMSCKDGYIAFVPVGAGYHDFASAVTQLVERPDMVNDPLFTNTQERVVRWADFDAVVQPWLDQHTVREIFERAGELGMGFGAVPDVAAQLADPHLEERSFWLEGPDGTKLTGASALMSKTPLRFSEAPALGADDDELLKRSEG
jgi:crotonobetainyl-CoA:carnitine CoA-transferase CaiB-like acyl-CoA transferase